MCSLPPCGAGIGWFGGQVGAALVGRDARDTVTWGFSVPEILSISAVTLATCDMKRAVRFYDALGFTRAHGGETGAFRSALSHLILPSIALGTIPLAVIARMTRSSMLEVLREDYVRTARAKGLPYRRVVLIHALRNALIPVITVIGLQVGLLLSGAILTETIFSWPGVGNWLIHGVQSRDYPVVQGGILLVASIVISVNLIVDLLYGVINPRIRHA